MFCLSQQLTDAMAFLTDRDLPTTKSDIVVERPCKLLTAHTADTADRHIENQIRYFGLNSLFDALTAKLIKKIKINNNNACISIMATGYDYFMA